MKSLIIGGSGQDGLILARKLRLAGHKLISLSSPSGDKSSQKQISDAFDALRPNFVYNLAGFSSVAKSWKSPAQAVVGNTLVLAELIEVVLATKQDPSIIHTSSSEVIASRKYTDSQTGTETLTHASPYSITKGASAELAMSYRRSHGIDIKILHLFNHESPLRPEHFVTQKIAKGVAEIYLGHSSFVQLGNVEVSRDWGYAPDYVDAMVLASELQEPADFQIATGRLNTLVRLLEVAFGSVGINDWQSHVVSSTEELRPVDHMGIAGDFSAMRDATGWAPRVGFEEMIEEMVQHQVRKIQGKTTDAEWLEGIPR